MEGHLLDKLRIIQTTHNILWDMQLPGNISTYDRQSIP